ncbi:uncharacterized protein LOC111058963 isoform X2 [Nilaparvata lugens]|uniref:uncharacterized protein LOC111058963 isoform X2 n=1 Tax=Nilaparvata lugens TaxID=108931 RepID=UPI00193E1DAB|nr:uncharacterized protein LOC111058963 isoform X2 [Nilaparvata lugens]
MDDGKVIENIKEMKDLPEKNRWKLVKSHSDTAESDIGSYSGVEKECKNVSASKKYMDQSTQVNEKSQEKVGVLESSSNVSFRNSGNVQVKFKEGPDEVFERDLKTVSTDQDTSDLLSNYVVLRDNCGPSCGQRNIKIGNNFPHVSEAIQSMTDAEVYHYHPYQMSAQESNQNQLTNKSAPTGDGLHVFGSQQNKNEEILKSSQNMRHRLNEKRTQINSETCRSIKRLKRIFGQEQNTNTVNKMHQNRSNEQHHDGPPIKHRNIMQPIGRGNSLFNCSPMRSTKQSNLNASKMTSQGIENIAKYTIFDGFHSTKRINMDAPPIPEYKCKQFDNGSGDTQFQCESPFVMNGNFDINDNKGDISIDKNGYRICNPLPERIEVYYFDHGSSSYFRTTDHPPPLATDLIIEKTDQMSTKFWAGIFGFLHIFSAVLTSFFLQMFRFILISSVRPLLIGTIQVCSDYFLKPFLATVFNAIIQPFFILMFNVATSFRDLCEPLARGIGFFLEQVANILRAIRLVEVKNSTRNGPFLNPFKNQAIDI